MHLVQDKDDKGRLILLMVYQIDDAYCTGLPSKVAKMLAHLKKLVEVLEIGRMQDHLSVSYCLEKDKIGWYYECKMSKYIKKTVAEYEHNMKKTLLEHPTPAAPGTTLSKLDKKETANCVDQF